MFEIKTSKNQEFESLMRELNQIESAVMAENRALAMDLMVIETKIRDRFERLAYQSEDRPFFNEPYDQLTPAEVQALIPYDLPSAQKNRIIETVCVAAVLAIMTALGIFGLVSLTQLVLGWIL